MSSSNDDLMYTLLKAKRDGEKIYCSTGKGPETVIKADHAWDLNNNVYRIRTRREYIIRIKDGESTIEETSNHWTRSDFGRSEGSDFILMREVFQEEM